MGTNTKRLTAADLVANSTKEITISTGHTVMIRKIGLARIVEITKGLPDIANLAIKDLAKSDAPLKDASAGAKLVEEIIVSGVVDPALSLDGKDGGARPCDFAAKDYALVFNEIMSLSGWSKEAAKEVLPLSETPDSSKR